ncbi:RNA exonuclease 5 [Salarias fasciatus]|uniref:RRM domain-containing protein n=1 Tax=Salarias fasciatus TaxID=181472 RepID=A0A672GAN3_SALFA|nr:RNA exonuclease 5 [Salarias fasciatus]XP_029949920.1 RNA exonuclease 5 [Salarias fasciatus]
MDMEAASSPPAAAAENHGGERKRIMTASHEEAKRLKTEQAGDGELQRVRASGPPRVSVLLDRLRQPITLRELTELLHYAALGKTGGIKQPSWCRLHHQKKVRGVNVAVVEGLTQSHFYKHYLTLQHLRTNYSTRVTFTPSSDNIASGIFRSEVPEADCSRLSSPESQLQKVLYTHPVVRAFGKQKRGLTAYVLSKEEMIKKHYPVKGLMGFEEFVCTDSSDSVTDRSPLFGLDCEMCLTVKGYELARVSLVDSGGTCLLDELVKPQNKILNYLTQFSGITAAMLRPVRTTLRDVQARLRALLPSDAVLVGHSIENDLSALKIIHPHLIDTSLLYRREFGQKFKLKVLAEAVLKRQIQTEERKGHDPVEDASAALELAQFFIQTGPGRVVELHLESLWGYTVVDEEPPECKPAPTRIHRFSDVLQTLGRTVAFSGRRSDVELDLSKQQWHKSDKELLASFRRQTPRPFLSVVQLSSVSDRLKLLGLRREQQQQQQRRTASSGLRDMCVVFAGPFPAGFSDREVRRLFRCCGPLQRIQMLHRVHARVEFKLLEGATLAVKTLNGLSVQGQAIKVRRPVHESTLDLDATLDALTEDASNTRHLYAVRPSRGQAEGVKNPPEMNGHTLEAERNGLPPAGTESRRLQLTEETLRETFSRFGAVEDVILLARPEKQARHAYIKFASSEGKQAALRSSEDLQREDYLVCPSATPRHLPSWVAMATSTGADGEAAEEATPGHGGSQDDDSIPVLQKLDRRLGKLFRSLPEGTLSVVLLPGLSSGSRLLPGLCLMEVRQASRGERT